MNSHPPHSNLRTSLIAASVLVLLMAACAPVPAPAPQVTPTPEPAVIKIGNQPFMGYAPMFIAQEEGFFAKHGLQAEFVTVSSASEALPSLIQGQLDVLLVTLIPAFFSALAGGESERVVMGATRLRPEVCASSGVVARRANAERLRDTANWRGLTLSTNPSGLPSISGFWLERALGQGGLTLADISTVKLPPASTAEALRSGSVDLVEMTEPWVTRAIDQADAEMVLAMKDVLPDGQFSVWVYGPNLLRDRDLGNRVALAYLEGLRQYRAGNTERNVAILARYTELEPDLLRTMCWPAMADDGSANLDTLVEFQAWAVKQGYLDKVMDTDAFWDGQFLEEARRLLQDQPE